MAKYNGVNVLMGYYDTGNTEPYLMAYYKDKGRL